MPGTDAGRASFWAEVAVERDGIIRFNFPNGITWDGHILEAAPGQRYSVQYYGNSVVTFQLEEDDQCGSDMI